MSEAERHALQRVAKASSERADTVKRAKALLAVADGKTFTQAGSLSGLSREGVSQLVGASTSVGSPCSLSLPDEVGSSPDISEERGRVLQEVQRQPDRERDQTATWSLKLLEKALRKEGSLHIGTTTIGRILHEEGYSPQRDRTWCDTGYAFRKRKDGIYRVRDPHAQKKQR